MISDVKNTTVCPYALKEPEMTAGDTTTLEVYAEQYGLLSEKIVYAISYYGKTCLDFPLLMVRRYKMC